MDYIGNGKQSLDFGLPIGDGPLIDVIDPVKGIC